MPRNTSASLGLPRFQGAVRDLIILNAAIFIVLLLLFSFARNLGSAILDYGSLSSEGIAHGWIWQFLTYGFLHVDPLNFALSMLGIYFIGGAVEDQIGSKRLVNLYLTALIGAGLIGFFFSMTGKIGHGGAAGSGPAANALLMVFYFLYREARVMPMFIPIPIPIKYIVIFTAAIEAAYLLLSGFSLMMMVQLLGLGMGYVWYRFMWRRRSPFAFVGNQMDSLRNSYHRWKLNRSKKKFQVYMKKHSQDPKDYFDEYGNFRPPDDKDKKNGGSTGGWVN
ncbi:MAG TPA: rhomboid family intramembrane serine protease [Candidatus Angelobacter sp.]|nr:rhomboid family intramembrane serine protease [Candidatus Angelobacter sp.]